MLYLIIILFKLCFLWEIIGTERSFISYHIFYPVRWRDMNRQKTLYILENASASLWKAIWWLSHCTRRKQCGSLNRPLFWPPFSCARKRLLSNFGVFPVLRVLIMTMEMQALRLQRKQNFDQLLLIRSDWLRALLLIEGSHLRDSFCTIYMEILTPLLTQLIICIAL